MACRTLNRESASRIDVAYRYFATPKRNSSFDTPGHEQYTRNMVTGIDRRCHYFDRRF